MCFAGALLGYYPGPPTTFHHGAFSQGTSIEYGFVRIASTASGTRIIT